MGQKKVRNLKRRFKDVENWKEQQQGVDKTYWEKYDREYAKLTIHPWYQLEKQKPPMPLFRQMVRALVDVHDTWRERLAIQKEDYLALWIFEDVPIESQVVAARDFKAVEYEQMFSDAKEKKKFPSQQFQLPELDEFEWELKVFTTETNEERLVWIGKRKN